MATLFILGWEEWLALPELELPAIKAKIDTGARTSALHATFVEPFGPAANPKVRFGVHPIPGRDDVEVVCTADIVDRREVTSSNGDSELRYVIRTTVAMGGRTWPIEITLANRVSMAYRMLLGRQAILDDMFVDPASSFRQPKLSYKAYAHATRVPDAPKPLLIALMTRRPDNASNRRLVRAAETRGHTMRVIDRGRLSLYIAARDPALFVDGAPLTEPSAVIVRAGRTLNAFSLAAVRQLEILGAYALNSADALARLGDGLAVRQSLARAGITVPEAAVSHTDHARPGAAESHILADGLGSLQQGPLMRFAVVGGRALAVIQRDAVSTLEGAPAWRAMDDGGSNESARALAEKAAQTLSLGLAAVDVAISHQGPIVVDVTANVSIAQFERLTSIPLDDAVIVHLEQAVRQHARRPSAAE